MGERIRTPDLLVRSQTLYPAELSTHAVRLSLFLYRTLLIILYSVGNVNRFFQFLCFFLSRIRTQNCKLCKLLKQLNVYPENFSINKYLFHDFLETSALLCYYDIIKVPDRKPSLIFTAHGTRRSCPLIFRGSFTHGLRETQDLHAACAAETGG